MSTFYRQRPGWTFARAVRGEGVYVWDDTGRRLLDAAGGALVVNVGHGVREIADAIAAQASTLAYVHGTELTTEPVDALARELARRAPMDDARLYLVARGAIVYASGGQAAGAGDLILLGPPLGITREQVDEAVDILGDAINAATRAAP